MNMTFGQTSIQTWKAVRRHYFMFLGGAILLAVATVAGVGAWTTSGSSDSAASILPPIGPAFEAGLSAQVTAPVTYYLVDSEKAALDWATKIEAQAGDDGSRRYFLIAGMAGFDEALATLDSPWLNANVVDLRGQ